MNKINHLVSIIIPAFNAENFILQSVESALKQKCRKEILIIDDHSNDGTNDLLHTKYGVNNEIRILKNKGKGANAARNYGISESSGEYIQFLDADDVLGENKIRSQLDMIAGDRSTVASCSWIHFTEDISHTELMPNELVWQDYSDPKQWLLDSWTGGGMMQTACWLTPKELVDNTMGWDESLHKNQDGEFFCRVLIRAQSILFTKDAVVYYRLPMAGHVSQSRDEISSESLLKSYESYSNELLPLEDSNEVRDALANNFFRFIYETHPDFPDLLERAGKNIQKLEVRNPVNVGGPFFKKITKLIGFFSALKLRRILSWKN